MISTGELKKGVAIELDGELWQILDYHHIKMGRGSAQVRITLRNIKRGQTVERSFQAGTKWPRASMEKRPVQFLYRDGDDFHFMQNDTYDQFVLSAAQLDDAVNYLKDGMTLDRTSYQGETIGVELPINVDLEVTETEPGFAAKSGRLARFRWRYGFAAEPPFGWTSNWRWWFPTASPESPFQPTCSPAATFAPFGTE